MSKVRRFEGAHADKGDVGGCVARGLGSFVVMSFVYHLMLFLLLSHCPTTDRATTAPAQPPCTPTQITQTLSKSYTNGVLSATFTRPLAINANLQSQGFVSVPNALVQVIAAIGSGPRDLGVCDMNQTAHYHAFAGTGVNFLA